MFSVTRFSVHQPNNLMAVLAVIALVRDPSIVCSGISLPLALSLVAAAELRPQCCGFGPSLREVFCNFRRVYQLWREGLGDATGRGALRCAVPAPARCAHKQIRERAAQAFLGARTRKQVCGPASSANLQTRLALTPVAHSHAMQQMLPHARAACHTLRSLTGTDVHEDPISF